MQLKAIERRLLVRLVRAERGFKEAVQRTDRHLRRHQLEGVLSDAWQAYCSFSREVCIQSAIGATTAGGMFTVPAITPSTWERASYIALRATSGASIQPGGLNSILRKEPTWGDSVKFDLAAVAMNPSNLSTLRANFVGGLTGPKHCQTVRNAAAHKNQETLSEVRALAPHYGTTPIVYPTDALTWQDPASGLFAFLSWLDDMRSIAAGAVA